MRWIFGWLMVVVLCGATEGRASEEPPDARLVEAQKAFGEATKLRDAGGYEEALTRARQALALREAALGGTHPDVASCLELVGELQVRQGNLADAESLYQRALTIREAALDKHHPDLARSLHRLATLYLNQRLYARAEPLFLRALAIREVALGKEHPDVAQTLNNLANLYVDQGLYARAEPLHQRALAIREVALGKNHPDVARSLSNIANLYVDQGLYARAEPLYQRALAILEVALGKEHPDVASLIDNLAVISVEQGFYDRAEPLYQRSLALREAALGKEHPDIAQTLNNLASLYADQGLYGRAEPLYQRALAMWEATLGKDHPDVARPLHNLAILYMEQGFYDRAEPLYQRSLALMEAALGKDHPEVASALANLALLYMVQKAYARAEPLFLRAISVQEVALGKDHPDLARSLNNLALVYIEQGLYGRATPLLQRALSIQEAVLGKDHPVVSNSLANLATVYMDQGMHDRAEPLLLRALSIQEAVLGKDHPVVAETLNSLALLRLNRQGLAVALPLFTRAFAISEGRLRHEALDFSESRLSGFLKHLREDEQALYALLRAHPKNTRVQRLALSAVLLRKGRSVEETGDISRTVYRSLGAEDREAFEKLRSLRTQLAALSLAGPGLLSPADYQQRLKTLSSQGDALEADLAKRSAPLRARTALPSPADIVDRVAASLPRDGALVELVAYQDRRLVSKPGAPRAKAPGRLRYLALVLFPDASTQALDLGPAAPIDLAATRLRDALANRDVAFQAAARELYRLVFQPLSPLLGPPQRLLISPDGQLGLVPFAALHDGRHFLLDSVDFTYLTSGRELLPRPQDLPPTASVFVLADPDFSATPRAVPSASGNASMTTRRSASLERFFSTLRAEPVASDWAPLPGTRQEAESIQRLLPQAQLFLGSEATKERLLQLPTPGILHLATHGFFLEDAPALEGTRAVVSFGALGDDSAALRPPDPLLRSGLALAGARASAPDASREAGPPPDATLVTALELAGLNLWGTQLVVLSACDTGRGDIQLGQGVSGLRRSLVVAGAETVVMSLWKVNDDSTRLLMETYYRNLLAGQGRASALRGAMRSLRASRPHPHHWAPFIALGSDAPLHAITPTGP